MDVIINQADGNISITIDDEEIVEFSDQTDPIFMIETLLTALGYNVDTIERNTEEGESMEDFQEEQIR